MATTTASSSSSLLMGTASTTAAPGGRPPLKKTPFHTNYLPGYTGHIPYQKEIYGCSLGEINKIVSGKATQKITNFDVDQTAANSQSRNAVAPTYGARTLYSKPPPKDHEGLSLQYGNTSKQGENWIGGPTVNARPQHIPGYQGYVPSIKAENFYGQSFGKSSSLAIVKDFPKDPGVGKPPIGSGVDRYKTQNRHDYSKENFRRLTCPTSMEPADQIDLADAQNIQDEEFQGIQVTPSNIYMTIQTVGYQGFKSMYRPPAVAMNHRKQPQFNVNSLMPRLPPSASGQILPDPHNNTSPNILQTAGAGELSEGFQRSLTSLKQHQQSRDAEKLPVLGYTGHRMGYKAQGFFGKNFRDCSIQSRNIQKAINTSYQGGGSGTHSQALL